MRVYLDVESYPDASPGSARVIAVGLIVDWTEYRMDSARLGPPRARPVLLAEWRDGGEEGVLRRLYGVLEGLAGEARFVEVVGFNILGFDLPLIVRRTVEHGLMGLGEALDYWYARVLKRDLFHAFLPLNCMTRRGLSLARLGEVARGLGVPVPPTVGRGSDVPRLYEEGRYGEILAHLEADLWAVRALDLYFGEVYRRLGACGLKDLGGEGGAGPG